MNKTVLIGLSGGVDSSVAALLLKKQGYNVHGVMMQVWDDSLNKSVDIKVTKPGCYGPDEAEDIESAKKVAEKLGIPFTLVDLRKEYHQFVVSYFIEEYKIGRTPNPCIQCNKNIKFGFFIKKLEELIKHDYFATGHYVRLIFDDKLQEYKLLKGIDSLKDQSYFLYNLKQKQLKKLIFPLGEYKKSDIKQMAKELELGLEEKKESMDFASIGTDELLKKIKSDKGKIINKEGEVLGYHKGIQYYTIGQRKGLNISGNKPLYVISIDKENNTIILDDEKNLFKTSFTVKDINWILSSIKIPMEANVKIRYRSHEHNALIENFDKDKLKVSFVSPQRAITPGQSAVFYDGEMLIGGGIIDRIL